MMNLTVDTATNRLQVAGMAYDANGNMTRTPEAGAITYDGRNRAQVDPFTRVRPESISS